jgi:putative aminopeptidase FrvX
MELAQRLCNTYGPSGREDAVRKLIKDEVTPLCDRVDIDRLGNLIAFKPRTSKNDSAAEKMMLCAHMDEIGVIVTHIDKSGFLRFTSVGGVHKSIVFQRVQFENGTIGVIGVETKKDTPKPPLFDNLFIDIGARDKEHAQRLVKIGDIAVFQQHAVITQDRFIGKALDDRIGCYCLIETLKKISSNVSDLYFVFSVQEEVGLRGARTGAYAIAPDYALAVDVTATGDTPQSEKMDVSIGKGAAIKVKDRAFISHPRIKDALMAYADGMNIPYQLEVLERGTTDAAIIQLVREGVVAGALSIPTRYIHSTSEMCDPQDIDAVIKLLTAVCEKGFAG